MDDVLAVTHAEERLDKLEGLIREKDQEFCWMYDEDDNVESKIHNI